MGRVRRFRDWPALLVLVVAAAGLVDVGAGHFKRGTVVFGVGVLLAGALRAALPARAAGVLAVRSRTVDVVTAAVLGVAVLAFVAVVPPFGFAVG